MVFELSQLYSVLISTWIRAEESAVKDEKSSGKVTQWTKQFKADFSKAGAAIQTLKLQTSRAQWEGSIRGAWPVDQYTELNKVETEMLFYLAQVCLRRNVSDCLTCLR